jgi:hypothetical protein
MHFYPRLWRCTVGTLPNYLLQGSDAYKCDSGPAPADVLERLGAYCDVSDHEETEGLALVVRKIRLGKMKLPQQIEAW